LQKFFLLRTAQKLQAAKQRVNRATAMMKNKDRAPPDQMSEADRNVFENYYRIVACKHVAGCSSYEEVPDDLELIYANVFCSKCMKELKESKGKVAKKDKRFCSPLTNRKFVELADMYMEKLAEK